MGVFDEVMMPGVLFYVCLECTRGAWRMASSLVGAVDVWRLGAVSSGKLFVSLLNMVDSACRALVCRPG